VSAFGDVCVCLVQLREEIAFGLDGWYCLGSLSGRCFGDTDCGSSQSTRDVFSGPREGTASNSRLIQMPPRIAVPGV
jgi:hypothetical protein